MRRLVPVLLAVAMAAGALPAVGVLDDDPLTAVTIYRDEYNIPHIFSDDAYALWYANGYVQGLDRLWELDLLRHLGYGEGSSVVGPGGGILQMDLDTRQRYSRAELQAMADDVDPGFVEVVQAYADGVNRAALELHATGNIPAEFPALQHTFEKWTVLDTVAVAVFLLAEFGNGGGGEVANAKLLAQLEGSLGAASWTAFEDLAWVKSGAAYPTIPEDDGLYTLKPQAGPKASFAALEPAQQAATLAAVDAEAFGPAVPSDLLGYLDLASHPLRFGSNALLVAPSLSQTGEAMVGGGPQMGFFNPQVPFELGLHGPGIDAVGMGVAGAPGVIIGRNANMAWTVTSGISDQTDMVALPAAAEREYLWDGDVVALDCRIEEHVLFTPPAVGGPALDFAEQEVCLSQVGPITQITYDANDEPAWFFAQHRYSRGEDLNSAVKWLSVDAVDNMDDFRDLFDGFVFTFNFNMAGKDANGVEMVCYQHVGANPLRNLDLDPRLPTPAGDAYAWSGVLTGPDLPQACNPAQGYYANWNNLPQRGWSSGDSRELWGSVHRVERLDKAVQDRLALSGGTLDLEDVKAILREAATHDSLAVDVAGALLANDPNTAPAAMTALAAWAGADYPWDNVALDDDGNRFYADAGHTVYDLLVEEALNVTFGDELDAFVRDVNLDPRDSGDPHAGDHGQHNNPFTILVDALTGEADHPWCDDVRTGVVESCADALATALANTGLDQYASVDDIPLTEEHRSPFTSLGTGPAYTMPMTNRATYYHFHVGSDTATSEATLPAGMSGHVTLLDLVLIQAGANGCPCPGADGPEHMHDQLELYVDFEGKPVPFTEDQAQALAVKTETLLVP